MDAFELVFMIFVLGAIFGGVVGAILTMSISYSTGARREAADLDVSE